MRFPVVLNTGHASRVGATLYYEVASNGLFQVRDTGIYRAVTRVEDGVPGLLPEEEHVVLRFPRLPAALLEEVLVFFREVYLRFGGEGIVLLFYRPRSRQFRVRVPPQTIPGRWDGNGWWRPAHQVRYRRVARPPGFLQLGTIHSHARLPAYASGVDCADEQYEDGLHVVFGELDEPRPSRCACFVARGVRFPLDPADALEPCGFPERRPRSEWMARVMCVEDAGWVEAAAPTVGAGPGELPPGEEKNGSRHDR